MSILDLLIVLLIYLFGLANVAYLISHGYTQSIKITMVMASRITEREEREKLTDGQTAVTEQDTVGYQRFSYGSIGPDDVHPNLERKSRVR